MPLTKAFFFLLYHRSIFTLRYQQTEGQILFLVESQVFLGTRKPRFAAEYTYRYCYQCRRGIDGTPGPKTRPVLAIKGTSNASIHRKWLRQYLTAHLSKDLFFSKKAGSFMQTWEVGIGVGFIPCRRILGGLPSVCRSESSMSWRS